MRKPASAEMVDRPTVGYTGEFVNFEAHEIAALARHAHDPQDAAHLPYGRVDRAQAGRAAGPALA